MDLKQKNVTNVSQFISVKVKCISRKSEAQFQENLEDWGSGKIMVFL